MRFLAFCRFAAFFLRFSVFHCFLQTQVALISNTQFGADKAIYINGEYLISADPGAGDSIEIIEAVSINLAGLLGVEVDEIDYQGHEDWQWNMIEDDLKHSGKLFGQFK